MMRGDEYIFPIKAKKQSLDLGSAGWCECTGAPPYDATKGYSLIFGARPDCFFREWYVEPVRKHFLTIGGTRDGKGTGLIIPNLLAWRGSCIVIDPKGENAWITAQARREKGQKVFILDPWGEVNRRYGKAAGEPETVVNFNPLSILDPTSPHYADDVAYLSDALIINQGNDPHWSDSARALVAGLIAFLVEEYKDAATLRGVRELLSKGAAGIAALAKGVERSFPQESLARRKLSRFIDDSKENSSIISTALTQTDFLDSAPLADSLASSDFCFDALVNTQSTIYLVLAVDKLKTHGRWLRLMISIAIRTIARNTRPLGLPVLFMLDEFGTIGKLSAIAQAFGLMAGLQMCVWAFLQDLSQLKRDYPDDWETFIANAQNITFFGLQDWTTCKYFSDLMGQTTIKLESQYNKVCRERKVDETQNDSFFVRQFLTPDELRRFPVDYGILLDRNNPIKFKLLKYYKQKEFVKLARPDPARLDYRKYKIKKLGLKSGSVVEKEIKKLGFEVIKAGGGLSFTFRRGFFIGGSVSVKKEYQTFEFDTFQSFTEWGRNLLLSLSIEN